MDDQLFGPLPQVIFALINFIWFFRLNYKLCSRFPSYNGRFLWSLFFFPQFLILQSIFNSLLWILMIFPNFTPKNVGIVSGILGLICSGGMLYVFHKLKDTIFNWSYETVNEGRNYVSRIIFLAVVVQIINAVFIYKTMIHIVGSLLDIYSDWVSIISLFVGELSPGYVANSSGFMFMIMSFLLCQFLLDYWIYNSAQKRLKILDFEFRVRRAVPPPVPTADYITTVAPHVHKPNSNCVPSIEGNNDRIELDNNVSGTNQLIEIKQLLDDGLLSEEEFREMKKEILARGL